MDKKTFVERYEDLLCDVADELREEIILKGRTSEIVRGALAISLKGISRDYVEVCYEGKSFVFFTDYTGKKTMLKEVGPSLYGMVDKICEL